MLFQKSHQSQEVRKSTKAPLATLKKSYLFMRYMFQFIFVKEEKELAKSTPMLLDSIGDQITSILRSDATQCDESAQNTNARLAMAIFDEFKEVQTCLVNPEEQETRQLRKALIEKLQHVDINPHSLAMRWLHFYTRDWWEYAQIRGRFAEGDKARGWSFSIE
jgi:hypothetical protein